METIGPASRGDPTAKNRLGEEEVVIEYEEGEEDPDFTSDPATDKMLHTSRKGGGGRKGEDKGGGKGGGGGGVGEEDSVKVNLTTGLSQNTPVTQVIPARTHKKGFFRRLHKNKPNGVPPILQEYLDSSSPASSPSPFLSAAGLQDLQFPSPAPSPGTFLSAKTDRTYNEMLQNRMLGHSSKSRIHSKNSIQSRVYNFLERPTGWKCFIYHFTV